MIERPVNLQPPRKLKALPFTADWLCDPSGDGSHDGFCCDGAMRDEHDDECPENDDLSRLKPALIQTERPIPVTKIMQALELQVNGSRLTISIEK